MNDTEPQKPSLPPRLLARLEALGVKPASALDEDPHAETAAEKAERLAIRRDVYLARWASQVPPMYAEASLADLDEHQRVEAPQEALNLVLAGPVGTGKTHAAYALGNQAARAGRWVTAVTVVDLLAAMRPEGDTGLVKAAHGCDLLILDDLGAGKATEFAVEQLTALLDHRIRDHRRTIVTTNVPEAGLEATWGGRFMDRLRYRRVVAVFGGPSRRTAEF